ncbi:DUF6227 family protein [Streptomyces sp. NBC_01465]|uniref:DUF6227 family protein n=1 Tax=Streptomyces sp. NBC_01465 TaxID=2903878 RepID=UPI002E35AE01|nr:DUF6227 family protein [Streptomyces sp. NBC_01465]
MSDPYETTEEHLAKLLGRALNSFELPDATVGRLDSALAHSTSLHSSHHSSLSGLHRETYRHSFLLADGSHLVLWEMVHNTEHELYAAEEEARLAASRVRAGYPLEAASPEEEPDAADLEILRSLMSAPPMEIPRVYVPDNSADHARRVLRRAENADRPGETTARLLRRAFAHEIIQAFGAGCFFESTGFTLYEHAFLLLDGSEISLWEVEHTATPDGRHMCEVYETEDAARDAMEHRSRVR